MASSGEAEGIVRRWRTREGPGAVRKAFWRDVKVPLLARPPLSRARVDSLQAHPAAPISAVRVALFPSPHAGWPALVFAAVAI